MKTAAIIVAAGRGTRVGGDVPKQYQLLSGQPVLARSIRLLGEQSGIDTLVLVLHPDDTDLYHTSVHPYVEDHDIIIVHGGATRAQSVNNGLQVLADKGISKVLIHDGARPLASAALIARLLAQLNISKAAAPALIVTDALWRGADDVVQGAHDRAGLYRAQTPQAFDFATIYEAHKSAEGDHADDVAVAHNAGIDVAIVEGEESNLKITTPADFTRAADLLRTRMDIRTGNGFDVHAFAEGDHVTLCGVDIAHSAALSGHSDADVAMHAVTDAIYGALAQGDIGQWFPPSDPQWKGAASRIFLEHAMERARKRGFTVNHIDCTIICELPKIGPHALKMRETMSAITGIDAERISVKATTSEKLGFTGRGEGISSMATATLVKL